MRKSLIVLMLVLFLVSVAAAETITPEGIQALQTKEATGTILTPAEKSLVAEYWTRQQLLNPWSDNSWGTDGWYSAVDQESGGQPFNWRDISTTGTEIWPSQNQDDTWSSGLALPFSFPFYWMHKSTVFVSANIILKFDAASSVSYSTPIPSNTQPPRIDPWCFDMYHLGADTVAIPSHYYYQAFGDSLFVVQFKGARYYNTSYRYDATYAKDLEILLYSDGRVVFQYDSLRNILAGSPFASGIDDSLGTAGLSCGNIFSQGQAITFTPLTGVFLTDGQVSPISGNTSTNFVYQVKYRNSDNFAPTSAQIYIDDVPYALVDSTSGAGNYFMGVNFYHTTTLAVGAHEYYFQFEYGGNTYRFPEADSLAGPIVYEALSGNYDIGGGANDFATIIDAASALTGAGVGGPVTFNVYSGTYDGQVTLPNTIAGLNETNTLTIQAAAGATPVVTNTTGSSSSNGNGFYIIGADYITIKGFEIQNCYYSGVYVYYTGTDSSKYVNLEDNYVHDIGAATTGYGLYVYRLKYGNILNNRVQGDYYGINVYYSSYCLIANNLVYGQDYYGLRNYYGTYNNYLYNSVYMNSTYSTTNYATYWYNSTGCVLKNNIFYNGGSGSTTKYAIYLSGALATYPMTSDYNDLYAPNSSVGYYTAARTTLADWRTATGLDANSLSADPNFVSVVAPFDLHIVTAAPSPVDGMGTPVAEVSVDFDYEARQATTPDIGGDEFIVVSVVYDVVVLPEAQNFSGSSGSDVAYFYYVLNSGNTPDMFNLAAFGAVWPTALYDSAGTTIINATPTLAVGDSSWVRVVHSIPGTALPGEFDTGFLTAVASQCLDAADTASFTTTVVNPPPFVEVTLAPLGPPIVIPATGGSFNFNLTLTNNQTDPVSFDLWMSTQLPGGNWHRTFGPLAVTLPENQTIMRQRTQTIPASAPAGLYTYRGWVGLYPTNPVDSSSFTFEKSETGEGAYVGEWACSGELFPGEALLSSVIVPTVFSVTGPTPNPFNPVTTIRLALPEASQVTLSVFDINGRQVAQVINGYRPAGYHQVTFDGSHLASGIYLYSVTAGSHRATGKMALIK